MAFKNFLKFAMMILLVIEVSSCGRKKETTESNKQASMQITALGPVDTAGVTEGDWIVKQEMSDAEKLNPVVTNDATASGISLYIFENLLEIDRVTYEQIPLLAKSLPVISDDHLSYYILRIS